MLKFSSQANNTAMKFQLFVSHYMTENIWFLYLIRCRNNTLYTGITTDVNRRFAEHQAGKGAKYLRGKSPLLLVYQQAVGSHADALKTEISIKKLSKKDKERMILGGESIPAC